MAEPARRLDADQRQCPRVVGASDDGKRVVTCGETIPCPYHGDGALRIVAPTTEAGE